MNTADVIRAKEAFAKLVESEAARIERMEKESEKIDYDKLDKIVVGVIPGDGIGPIIMKQSLRLLNYLLKDKIEAGKIEFNEIAGLSIEERTEEAQSVAPKIMEELKKCDVLLKGPMMTPRPGDPWPYLPSANAIIRRELDLFANIRPVSSVEKGIDWVMFRENIEGAYIWGSKGIQVDDDLAVDFVVETRGQSYRLAEAAFEYAKRNNRKHVTAITKVNIVKLTDGNLLKACREVSEKYPDIEYDERLVDITAAKLDDKEFSKNLEVLILPNLYGDIISDVAAELSGGVSTAGSANIGTHYALFEAIHGTAPFLINNNRGDYANPSSLFKACSMMLNHINYIEEAQKLEKALLICGHTEKKLVVTSFPEDASAAEFTDYMIETIKKM